MDSIIVVLSALPIQGRMLLMRIFTVRKPDLLHINVRGYGVSLHRRGGVSLCGIPGRGGTTLAWGKLKAYMESNAVEVRALLLGPLTLFVGRDF